MEIARQYLRPGLAGYSPRPVQPDEAHLIQNLVLTRDGHWVPRPAMIAVGPSYGAQVWHVSTFLNTATPPYPIVVSAGGQLVQGDITGTQVVLAASGWPQQPFKHCQGGTATDLYWIAAASNQWPYRINGTNGFGLLGGAMNIVRWVESHGVYTLIVKSGQFVFYSAEGDSDTWPAANYISVPREMGICWAALGLSDNQVLLLGTTGAGLMTGSSSNNFAMHNYWELTNFLVGGAGGYGAMPLKFKGNRIVGMDSGGRVYLLDGGALNYIGQPVRDDLRTAPNLYAVGFSHDPARDYLYVSDPNQLKTWVYSLERQRWEGIYTTALVGPGAHWQTSGAGNTPDYVQSCYGAGNFLVRLDPTQYADTAGAYTCAIETAPQTHQKPEMLKQITDVFVDGAGTWSVSVQGRATPEAAFSTVSGPSTVTAPARARLAAYTPQRENLVRLTATAASNVSLRGVEIGEALVREAF